MARNSMRLGVAAYYRSIARWLKLRAQRQITRAELEKLDREMRTLDEQLLPTLRLGPKDVPPGIKVLRLDRLERLPNDDPERLLEGARYCEQLAAEANARKADKHYER